MSASVTDVLCRHLSPNDDGEPTEVLSDGTGANGLATKRLYESGLPSRHTEEWKYTPIEQVLNAEFSVASSTCDPDDEAIALVRAVADLGGARVVIVNGRFAASLSRISQSGVTVTATTESRELNDHRVDGMAALNAVVAPETVLIKVSERTELDEPIHVVYCARSSSDQAPVIVHPRVQLIVGAGARAKLVESYVGSIAATTTNASLTIDLEQQAVLNHVRVQTDGPASTNLGFIRVGQAGLSAFESTSIMAGSRIGRLGIDLTIHGERATTDLAGLAVTQGDQKHDHTVTIDHAASYATTSQLYKAVVDHNSTASFTGHIIVGPQTLGTVAHQTNRSLLLSDRGTANSRPWLEILADDVRCAHGSTVGRLDEDQLFYLRSRGIGAEAARSMLIGAFTAEITRRCGDTISAELSHLIRNVAQ